MSTEKKEEFMKDMKKRQGRPESSSGSSSGDQVGYVFEKIKGLVSDDLVQSVNGVFQFKLKGDKEAEWYLDLKNGSGIVVFLEAGCIT